MGFFVFFPPNVDVLWAHLVLYGGVGGFSVAHLQLMVTHKCMLDPSTMYLVAKMNPLHDFKRIPPSLVVGSLLGQRTWEES